MNGEPVRLTRAQVREVDRLAIEEYHIPGVVLMENASRAVVDVVRKMTEFKPCAVAIVCGGGNNGGDGLVAARHLWRGGARPSVFLVEPDRAMRDPAAGMLDRLRRETDVRVGGVDQRFTIELQRADLVVDAMGRRSRLPALLTDHGAQPVHEEAEDLGFIYYTRFYRSADGALPPYRAPLLTPFSSFSLLTLPADNGTWSMTIYVSAGDRPMKVVRDPDQWSALVRACPAHAHWIDHEPVSDLIALGGVVDRYRRFGGADGPVATGVIAVADAWACTNPSLGRGMTLGLLHAVRLRDAVASGLEDPQAFAEAWDALTEEELTPWYRETVEEDRDRLREIDALRYAEEHAVRYEATALAHQRQRARELEHELTLEPE